MRKQSDFHPTTPSYTRLTVVTLRPYSHLPPTRLPARRSIGAVIRNPEVLGIVPMLLAAFTDSAPATLGKALQVRLEMIATTTIIMGSSFLLFCLYLDKIAFSSLLKCIPLFISAFLCLFFSLSSPLSLSL